MEDFILVGYQLVKSTAIRDEPYRSGEYGDIIDWKYEVIAESKTLKGLLQFARMKKLETNHCEFEYQIESVEKEYIRGYGYKMSSGNLLDEPLENYILTKNG